MLEISTDDVGSVLRRQLERAADLSDLLQKSGTLAMDSMKKDIEESRTPAGDRYPDLKEATIRAKERHHSAYATHPLLDTTAMYQSIHFEVRGDHEVWAGPSLEDAPYFARQNQGAPRRGIPARTFIGLRPEDLTEIEDAAAKHFSAAFNG